MISTDVRRSNKNLTALILQSLSSLGVCHFNRYILGVMMKLTFFALILSFNFNLFASEVNLKNLTLDQRKALTIGSVEVKLLDNSDKDHVELPSIGTITTDINEISIMIDSLIALGKKVWPIIEAGRPVINDKLAPAVSIIPHLPNGESGVFYDMENWSAPSSAKVKVSYKNLFGIEVVGFTYTVFFQHGGSYHGTGRYVGNLSVVASDIYTAWGFNFDASSELISIANVGSSSNPVASGNIKISYRVLGKLNEARTANVFYVDGNGKIQVIGE